MKLLQHSLFFFVFWLIYSVSYAAEPVSAGTVSYVRGIVSAKSDSGGKRLLNKDAAIYETDSIVTGSRSFIVLEFNDKTKMTIRPNSVFIISQYQFNNNANDKANFRLLKGGIRSVTGSINKNKAEKMRIVTPVATMGVRGTDFIARLCDGDCRGEEDNKNGEKSKTVARLALAKGSVTIKDTQGGTRPATTGDRLKASDSLVTDKKAFAVLVFNDNTRVTVQPATELNIATYIFPKGRPKQGKVLLDLIKGGARTLTGLIGKANPDEFQLKTPTATMGMRGTGFDTYHDGKTYVTVWQGGVTANQSGKTQDINLNQTFQMGGNAFNQLDQLPQNLMMQFNNTPRPDKVNTQSIWVSVKSGNVRLTRKQTSYSERSGAAAIGTTDFNNNKGNKDGSAVTGVTDKKESGSDGTADDTKESSSNEKTNNNTKDKEDTVDLSAGETGVANEAETNKVSDSPPFIENDPYTAVSPINVEATSDVFGNPDGDNKSCTVQ